MTTMLTMTTMPSTTSSRLAGLLTALGVCAIPFALALSARGDTVKTPNGETLNGTIIQTTEAFILFRSASFGEIKIPRTPGTEFTRSAAAAPAASAALAGAPAGPAGAPPPPPPGLIKSIFSLSDRWSAELEGNLMIQNDSFKVTARGTELTIGYKVPNATKPSQPFHDFGLFGAYNFQKVNDTVVGENSEFALRYFYQPLSSWLLVSQADWSRDRINGIDFRSNVIAVPAYRFIDSKSARLFAGFGPSFNSESTIISSSPNGLREESSFRVAFYQLYQQTITPGLTFRQTLLLLSRPKDPGDTYNLRLGASLRRMLTPNLSLSLSYNYLLTENDYVLPDKTPVPSQSISTLKLMLGYRL
jgi:hypothetical protein